jgi:ligand-binding SRPBCC domain-containing protein
VAAAAAGRRPGAGRTLTVKSELTLASVVAAEAPVVWRRVASAAGINHELMPVLRMTVPRGFRDVTADDLHPGARVGRSYLLLLGVLPFAYDDIAIAELEPGRRFLESSRMLAMRVWQHERAVRPVAGGTEIRDTVRFVPGVPLRFVPGAGWLVGRALAALFAHRHRRLLRHFGPAPEAPA